MSQSIADCLRLAARLISVSDTARLDTEVLLAHALQKGRGYLYTWPEKKLETRQFDEFQAMFARREAGEPVAYIVGEQEFWSLPLYVNASTLIPRPETECLVEQALPYIQVGGRVLDLGTGTGAIALAIAKELPSADIVAVDDSPEAVSLAQRNRARHRLANVTIVQSDWFAAVDGQFDMILSNPPYICENDCHLEQGDVRFEPRSALVANEEGLQAIREIAEGARPFLKEGGHLLVEHGWNQAEVVRSIFSAADYVEIATQSDYSNNDRLCLGRYFPPSKS